MAEICTAKAMRIFNAVSQVTARRVHTEPYANDPDLWKPAMVAIETLRAYSNRGIGVHSVDEAILFMDRLATEAESISQMLRDEREKVRSGA